MKQRGERFEQRTAALLEGLILNAAARLFLGFSTARSLLDNYVRYREGSALKLYALDTELSK